MTRKARPARATRLIAATAAAGLLLAACGGDGDEGGSDGEAEGDGGSGEASGDAIDLSGEANTELEGSFSILHAFTGEADVGSLQAVIDGFNEVYPNIEVEQQGDNNFESLARTRVQSGQAPDILLHPQPGLLEDFYNAEANYILSAPDDLGDRLVSGLLDLGSVNDDLVAVPLRLSLKSLVWYNKPAFDAGGYEIPETWDDLLALTEQIAADGDVSAPWCIGVESGDATGWTATDWIEDILLRAIGPEQYDAWVEGELGFASDEVQGAIEENLVPIWTNDDYVLGGRENIARTAFGEAVIGITTGEGGDCMLHRQATFIEGFIEENAPDAEFGTDYDFFFLPSIDEEFGDPALGAGDYAALYTENEAAVEFLKYLTTAEAGEPWAERGSFLSPFTDFDNSIYPSESTRKSATLLSEATSFRFDGSDLMPANVGSSSSDGSFWNEITAWVTGQVELGDALSAIDETYAAEG